jgi:hypothetical protein
MLKLSKTAAAATASSVSTATLSDDDFSQDLTQTTPPVDWMTAGGTPFSKLLECCLPRHSEEEDSHEVIEEPWVRPPMEEIETKERGIDHEEEEHGSLLPFFDACIVLQLAVLGGFLAIQVVTAM